VTTTTKITTHGWPARITVTDRYKTSTSGILHVETYDLPRWSENQIAITDTRSVQFEELTSEGWQDKPEAATPAS
jgi:hypothetical protein